MKLMSPKQYRERSDRKDRKVTVNDVTTHIRAERREPASQDLIELFCLPLTAARVEERKARRV